jgi:hypothetical protein
VLAVIALAMMILLIAIAALWQRHWRVTSIVESNLPRENQNVGKAK